MPNPTTRPIAVKLDEEVRARIKHLAETKQRTTHWLLREAISQYLEREEKREVFRQDAIHAWNEYQTAGLHSTAAEADAWLAKLEKGEDLDPPECHT